MLYMSRMDVGRQHGKEAEREEERELNRMLVKTAGLQTAQLSKTSSLTCI